MRGRYRVRALTRVRLIMRSEGSVLLRKQDRENALGRAMAGPLTREIIKAVGADLPKYGRVLEIEAACVVMIGEENDVEQASHDLRLVFGSHRRDTRADIDTIS